MDTTLRALNGFGLGARPGERRRITDHREWLRAQLKGAPPALPAPADAAPADIAAALAAFRAAAQGPDAQRREARQQARRRLVAIAAAEARAALTARVTSDRPFVERLVAFWSNHLCVSTGAKILVAPLAGSYEREAIRPHVLGRFADMVLASAKHPAMLVYLDNFQSIGPNSRGAQAARGQRRGLNENYARELLELHTLGVDGGYTQQDVQELAKMLTGWTVGGLGRPNLAERGQRGRRRMAMAGDDRVGFEFQELLHEPGSKTLLGIRYAEAGVTEAEHAIAALCRHASTARFVATKLVTHFAGDTASRSAIDRIATVFRETNGDLRAVSMAVIDLPEVWTDSARKFRTPQDWLVAVLRAFNAGEAPDTLMPLLRQLRHPLWSPQAPKGFDDTTQAWADPDSLLNRAELARTITRRFQTTTLENAPRGPRGLRLPRTDPGAPTTRTLRRGVGDPRDLLDVIDVPAGDPLSKFLGDTSIAVDERVALALAGPAFQWR
jgi:uncharacterized protein (DUF1800 family)